MQETNLSRIVSAMIALPGVQADRLPQNGTDFLLGRREIGHVHGNQLVDIPFPKRVRDRLVRTGRAQPHHLLKGSGWVSIFLTGDADVERAIELLKLSYDLAVAN